jgi:hypothetical protein
MINNGLPILLVLLSPLSALSGGPCTCRRVPATEITRHGGNETIEVTVEKVHRALAGVVRLNDDEPVADTLVEVFRHVEGKGLRKPRRVAACLTDEDGKYCFGFLPPGKYKMRVSREHGFNITHLYVTVDPYSLDGSDDEIDVSLDLAH